MSLVRKLILKSQRISGVFYFLTKNKLEDIFIHGKGLIELGRSLENKPLKYLELDIRYNMVNETALLTF
mgnify:CR=1 FL=1